MKKNRLSFLAGMFAALLLAALTTTALAASGKVTFSFANVALNGEVKIAADSTITVANGQQVPGSILYVDEIGGKTNYLPIRAISELLGVDIDYDSATKTVMLMTKTWQRSVDGKYVTYSNRNADASKRTIPMWQPSWIPEGLGLVELWHSKQGSSVVRTYENGNVRISYTCLSPGAGSCMFGTESKESAQNCQQVSIQGNEADYYIGENNKVLVWENNEGFLFKIVAKNLPEEDLFQFAESCILATEEVDAYELRWLPSGYTFYDSYATPDSVYEQWVKNGVALTWLYSAYPIGDISASAKEVSVRGETAWYCEAELPFEDNAGTITVDGETVDGDSAVIGNVVVSGVTVPGSKRMNSLVWTDPETGTHFKLQSILDMDTMIRIAERVA